MTKYNKEFKIPYYESDKYAKITPLSLLEYLGETSVSHNDDLGFDIERLKSLNYGWMLNRWRVRIDRYPSVGEKIKIETWISKIEKFYANREFIIYDEKDLEIGRASTLWIFIDMTKKKPIRITSEFYDGTKIIDSKAFDDFYKFDKDIEIDNYIDFHIRRSDIDYNNHVNNTKYLSWMIEAIPENIYENYILNEFEILYKKETLYGNNVLSNSKIMGSLSEETIFLHSIMDKETEDNNAMGLSKWKKS